jgi:hypothetical protein
MFDVIPRVALGVGFLEKAGQLVAFGALSFFGRARCSANIEGIETCRGVKV